MRLLNKQLSYSFLIFVFLPQVIKLILRSNGYDNGEPSSLGSNYLTDEEYGTYWFRLSGLREKVAENIKFQNGMKIIDVGTG